MHKKIILGAPSPLNESCYVSGLGGREARGSRGRAGVADGREVAGGSSHLAVYWRYILSFP